MRLMTGTLCAILCLAAPVSRARAFEWHHGPELQGGLGHYTLSDE